MERFMRKRAYIILWNIYLSMFIISWSYAPATGKESKISGNISKPMPGKLKGKIAPDFILDSITGEKYQLSSTKGKVVLIDFWHTY
jgi:cytochrome oxidase Cu insertion factor (SCO1/SenC/PrrC family)